MYMNSLSSQKPSFFLDIALVVAIIMTAAFSFSYSFAQVSILHDLLSKSLTYAKQKATRPKLGLFSMVAFGLVGSGHALWFAHNNERGLGNDANELVDVMQVCRLYFFMSFYHFHA